MVAGEDSQITHAACPLLEQRPIFLSRAAMTDRPSSGVFTLSYIDQPVIGNRSDYCLAPAVETRACSLQRVLRASTEFAIACSR